MTEQDLGILPSGKYEADEIESSLQDLPEELRQVVRNGILKAKERKVQERAYVGRQLELADFAIALHIHMGDQDKQYGYVDGISWWRRLSGAAEDIVRSETRGPVIEIPDSVRKVVAFVYAYDQFLGPLAEREEVDTMLVPFGYSTQRILDNYDGEKREQIEEMIAEHPYACDIFSDLSTEDIAAVRRDMQALGYRLPELDERDSYGYDDEEGENRIIPSRDMLPE